ncbi:MAG: DNA polymerase domain-containing protein [Thermodesulfobacteriota bacterium]
MAYQFETGQYNHYNRSIVVWARQDLKTRYQFEVTGFEPYFYILEHETVPEDPRIKRVEEGEFIDLWGNKLKRVFTHDPLQVKQLRDDRLFERTWEADIRYVLRFIIDMGIRSGFTIGGTFNNIEKKQINHNQLAPIDYTSRPLYSVIDLEMDAEELPNPKNPVFTIISATVFDNRLETYITYFLAGYDQKAVKRKYKDKIENWLVIRFEKEINLILSIKLYLEQLQPTLIAGWNVDFDIDNLVARAAFLDIKINLRGMMPFDIMLFFPKVAQKNLGKKLKFVAIEEEILDKDELVMDEFDPIYYKDSSLHDDLILYNCFDVFICVELIKRYGIDLAFTGRKDACGQYDIAESLSNTHVIDAIALRVAQGQFNSPLNVILPTAVKRKHETYPAAINFPPTPGIYNNIALFDFSRFFPLTIMAYNFSPEFEGLTTEERLKKPKGILYWIAKVLIDNRAKEDDKLQEILETVGPDTEEYKLQKIHRDNAKFLLNAVYGACAYPNFRLYSSKQVAKMVAKAMDGLRLLKTESEKLGYRVIYGHTDSIMVACGRDEASMIQDALNKALKAYQENEGVETLWEIKFESYASKVLFTPAKSRLGKRKDDGARTKYAMLVIEKDGIELDTPYTIIKGFEAVRSDSSKITKELQSECFKAVFNDNIEPFVKRVQKLILDIKNGKYSYDEICIAMNLGKELNEYKGNNLQKRGCIYSAKNFGWKFGQGDRIKMLFVKEVKGYPATDILCYYDEKKLPKIIPNYTKIIERTIKSPIELILQVAGYHWNRILGQSSLFDSLGVK